MDSNEIKNIIDDIENKSTNDLKKVCDELQNEFNDVKTLILDLVKHIEIIEHTHNNVIKEINKRSGR
jgi:hypothetical protein